jgi:two-component system, LytTR family, response regulator
MNIYNCIIVDDDEMDRLLVTAYAKRFDSLKIVGIFETAKAALSFLEKNTVDIAFLDIELENENGINLRKKAMNIPACVFITSHSESAAETFLVETLDFIVKPYNFERFSSAMARVQEYLEMKHKAALFETSVGGDAVYLKVGNEQIKIKMHDILYLEALRNYTIVVTDKKRHCVLNNLGEMLQENIFKSFVRIHRSFAVQKQFINKITTTEVFLHDNSKIPVGRSYKDNLMLIF